MKGANWKVEKNVEAKNDPLRKLLKEDAEKIEIDEDFKAMLKRKILASGNNQSGNNLGNNKSPKENKAV